METAKHTHRSAEQKKRLLNRLKRIEGQIRGIEKLVEEDAYCNDILQQSVAAGSALDGFNRELLAAHVRCCVRRELAAGNDDIIEELMQTIQKLMK